MINIKSKHGHNDKIKSNKIPIKIKKAITTTLEMRNNIYIK